MELAGGRKPSQSLLKISDAGIKSIKQLAWILPLNVQKMPTISPFNQMEPDKLFLGAGELIGMQTTPALFAKAKRGIQLFNITGVIKDQFSEQQLSLKWFNAYPSLKKQLESLKRFTFIGKVSEYRGTMQIVNPKINPGQAVESPISGMLVDYPTINSVPGKQLKTYIAKISNELWLNPFGLLDLHIEKSLGLLPFNRSIMISHGLFNVTEEELKLAKERIIYEEFLDNQIKILARKFKNKRLKASSFIISDSNFKKMKEIFPYQLTIDQVRVLNDVRSDLLQNSPMMRLIQGDVGCGKTTIAIIAALIVIKNNQQVALMCPTEALAIQHFQTLTKLLRKNCRISLLLGSTKNKEKKEIYNSLKNGHIDFIIGTHSLIQDSIVFKCLGLSIIDEQHKFGVQQRLRLSHKGTGVHSLIMSATPIPRSLQLAQYGDLDISTIKVMPGGRKGIQTRIVTSSTYEKYLCFLKTRMSMGEQVYVVVPAIEESENFNLKNVIQLQNIYKKFFPDFSIAILHGQLSSDEKKTIMESFEQGSVNLLISTTVIEVGINILNSTVIAIYNPDRFGLSSLHQLRGRVGRGDKPGFCFLITDETTSKEAIERIKIIEKTIDGFKIAEADLKNRGQGDLFGSSQSGHLSPFKIGNIITHYNVFEKVAQDIRKVEQNHTEYLNQLLINYIEDAQISTTI